MAAVSPSKQSTSRLRVKGKVSQVESAGGGAGGHALHVWHNWGPANEWQAAVTTPEGLVSRPVSLLPHDKRLELLFWDITAAGNAWVLFAHNNGSDQPRSFTAIALDATGRELARADLDPGGNVVDRFFPPAMTDLGHLVVGVDMKFKSFLFIVAPTGEIRTHDRLAHFKSGFWLTSANDGGVHVVWYRRDYDQGTEHGREDDVYYIELFRDFVNPEGVLFRDSAHRVWDAEIGFPTKNGGRGDRTIAWLPGPSGADSDILHVAGIVGGESVLMRWDAGEWTVQPYSVFSVPTTPPRKAKTVGPGFYGVALDPRGEPYTWFLSSDQIRSDGSEGLWMDYLAVAAVLPDGSSGEPRVFRVRRTLWDFDWSLGQPVVAHASHRGVMWFSTWGGTTKDGLPLGALLPADAGEGLDFGLDVRSKYAKHRSIDRSNPAAPEYIITAIKAVKKGGRKGEWVRTRLASERVVVE